MTEKAGLYATPLTPAQPAGIGVIALWGPGAGGAMRQWFPALKQSQVAYRRLARDGDPMDEAVVSLMAPSHALTGLEEGEIDFHGGVWALKKMLEFCESMGAVIKPPEAYIAHAAGLDLLQQEALTHLRHARTMMQARFLCRQLAGGLSRLIQELAAADMAARLPALERLYSLAGPARRLIRGGRVLVAGPPNAGKSTLINRLCRRERAIVTDIPGTTRDLLEAPAMIDGWPVVFVDSAGLRPDGEVLERMGAESVARAIAGADLVLCLGMAPEALARAPAAWMRLKPKADLSGESPDGQDSRDDDPLPVSGLTGLGVDRLRQRVAARLFQDFSSEEPAPFTERQVTLILDARSACIDEDSVRVEGALNRLLRHPAGSKRKFR